MLQIRKQCIHLDTPSPSPFPDEAAPSQTATVGLEQMLQQAALRSIQAAQLDSQQWEWERPKNRSEISRYRYRSLGCVGPTSISSSGIDATDERFAGGQ